MTPDAYLEQLRAQLKGFSPEAQAALLDEIASHLESGANDPHLGKDTAVRQERLMAEMGTPAGMGQSLRGVHRPRRWLDLLLVLVPVFIQTTLLPLVLYSPLATWPYELGPTIAFRINLFIGALLILIGLHRRSVLPLMFWIPATTALLISFMTRENHWMLAGKDLSALIQSLFWWAALLTLFWLLLRVLREHQHDLLLVTFGLWPFLLIIANIGTFALYSPPPVQLLSLATRMPWMEFIIKLVYWGGTTAHPLSAPQVPYLYLLWSALRWGGLAMLFLLTRRDLRWLGLGLTALAITGSVGLPYWAASHSPAVLGLWLLQPAAALLGWWLDRRLRHPVQRLRA